MRKNYSEEQKKEIVSRYRLGEKISNICEDTGISKSTNKYIEFYNSKRPHKANIIPKRKSTSFEVLFFLAVRLTLEPWLLC